MIQIIEQTHEEKITMYMKLSKEELIAMLMENQRLLWDKPMPYPVYPSYPQQPTYPVYPDPNAPYYTVTCSIK